MALAPTSKHLTKYLLEMWVQINSINKVFYHQIRDVAFESCLLGVLTT